MKAPSASTATSQYSINGGRTEYNNWEIDGGDNMDNGSNTTLNVYPNLEAIAEFKVLTSNYGAQYGRNASGTIEVETKSGTNSFHGSAFEYLRNDMFNARRGNRARTRRIRIHRTKSMTLDTPLADRFLFRIFTTPIRRRPSSFSRRNGGVKRIRHTLQRESAFGCGTLAEIFQILCPDPNVSRSQIVRIKSRRHAAFPAISSRSIPTRNFCWRCSRSQWHQQRFPRHANSTSLPTTWREELFRIDHNITDNYRLTFRYIHDSWKTITPGPLWGAGTSSFPNVQHGFAGPGTSFVARLTANITPTLAERICGQLYRRPHYSDGDRDRWDCRQVLPVGSLFPMDSKANCRLSPLVETARTGVLRTAPIKATVWAWTLAIFRGRTPTPRIPIATT